MTTLTNFGLGTFTIKKTYLYFCAQNKKDKTKYPGSTKDYSYSFSSQSTHKCVFLPILQV